VNAHPEIPVVRSHAELQRRVGRILAANKVVKPRDLQPPAMLGEEEKSMWLLICNVAGTLAPEPWLAMNSKFGIEELKITTAHEPDYDKLMAKRMAILRENGIKLQDLFNVVEKIDVLPGAKEFLEWLKPILPRAFLLTDSFEEYALPIFDQLGHPMVFCNFLEADEDGYLAKHIVRLKDQKLKTVQEFQRLNFRVIAVGYSFNDIPLLREAEQGILFNPSDKIVDAHPDLPCVRSHDELKDKILEIIEAGKKKSKTAP